MKILVVEDDKTMRMVICHVLKTLGEVDLVEASDGLEAWKLLELGLRPDLCVIDLLMPNMDGLELVQRIRFKAGIRTLKVIICSSTKERHRIAEANSMEISGYIVKPFSANKIQEEVRRVMQLPSNAAPAEKSRVNPASGSEKPA